MFNSTLLIYVLIAIIFLLILGYVYITRRVSKELQTMQNEKGRLRSELDEAQSALAKMQRSISEEQQFRVQILNIAAHELKNPLVAVVNFGELLSEPSMTASERNVILSQSSGMAKRALDLIESLLNAHKLDVGQVRAEIHQVSLLPILHSLVVQYRELAKHKSIIIFNEYPLPTQTEIFVQADEIMVKQILENIISNAVKFTAFNKSIIVRIKEGETNSFVETALPNNRPALSQSSARTYSKRVRVEVQDEGPGISVSDMNRMFGMFTQLSAKPTGGEQSTGVGLSVAKRLSETINGRIWCESNFGEGSTFVIEFPA